MHLCKYWLCLLQIPTFWAKCTIAVQKQSMLFYQGGPAPWSSPMSNHFLNLWFHKYYEWLCTKHSLGCSMQLHFVKWCVCFFSLHKVQVCEIPPKLIRTKSVFFYGLLEDSKNAGLHQQTSYFWQTLRFHGFLVLLVGTEFHKSVNCSVNHVEMIWAQNLLSCSIHNHCFPSMLFVAVINGVFSHLFKI